MPDSNSHSVLVMGAGKMGGGIAQVAAQAGCHVWLCDISLEAASQGLSRIEASLMRAVGKGYLDSADAQAALQRIQPVDNPANCAGFQFAIEAVREDLDVKRAIFQKLEQSADEDAILLTNTSMISITSIADGLRIPSRVAGCHFFNPVPRMELVEVIPGRETSQQTVDSTTALVTGWGKTPILAPDTPGFIVNRAFGMMINEAAFLVQEGVDPKDVDTGLKLGCNHPMGPCELMDLVGVDVALDCAVAMWKQYDCAPKYEPCPLLREMVEQGKLGCKSGQGFYNYDS